jgi:hypothetical protein
MEAMVPNWRVLSASVPGSSHLTRGVECQDFNSVSILPDGTLIVVVCDGAGSATRAADGAALAARSSVEFLAQHLGRCGPADADGWKRALTDCLVHVKSALVELADRQTDSGKATEYTEFATTLLIAVVSSEWLATAQIGDGAIVSRGDSGVLSVLTVQGESEYINETTFITSSDFLDRAHFHVESSAGVSGVSVLTDGMQLLALKYADNTAHAPFFASLFDFAAQPDSSNSDLEDFLQSERVCERTDDDKTLVLAVRI